MDSDGIKLCLGEIISLCYSLRYSEGPKDVNIYGLLDRISLGKENRTAIGCSDRAAHSIKIGIDEGKNLGV